jgi:hypothetical protein
MILYKIIIKDHNCKLDYLTLKKLKEIKDEFNNTRIKENINDIMGKIFFKDIYYKFYNRDVASLKRHLLSFYITGKITNIKIINDMLYIDNYYTSCQLNEYAGFDIEELKILEDIISNNYIYNKDFVSNEIPYFKEEDIDDVISSLNKLPCTKTFSGAVHILN